MIEVKDINIFDIFGGDFLYIEFTIDGKTEDLTEYKMDILRSTSEHDGYTVIAEDIKDFCYKDEQINLYNPAIRYWYKVKITNIYTNEEYTSPAKDYLGPESIDNYGFALPEIYETYLETAIDNEDVYLLKKIKEGIACPCIDPVRNRSKDNKCPKCFGTGILGGYFKSQKMKVSFYNSPGRTPGIDFNEVGEDESTIQLWTSNYPLIQLDDIIVDKNNVRYIVMSWQPTYKNYYLLRQVVQVKRVPRYSIEYSIPTER